MQMCEKCGMTIYTNNPKRTLCRSCEQDQEEDEKFNKLSEHEQNEILAGENKYNLNGGQL